MGILHRMSCAADSSTAAPIDRHDDLAAGMLGLLVADGSGDLIEPILAVDHRLQFAGLQHPGQYCQVRGVHFGHEGHDFLIH
jgi:hypothetical protein